jgi:acetolactate synthase-1/2/3 large subunit
MSHENPRKLGMTGMHGLYAASATQNDADLIIGVGVRFSDRATGNIKEYTNDVKIIHIDIDHAEIGKNVPPDSSVIGDIRLILHRLCHMITLEKAEKNLPEWSAIAIDHKEKGKKLYPPELDFTPRRVIKTLRNYTENDTPIATDVGQHQMWTAMNYDFAAPRTFITSGGLGTMGFGLGASIGASVGTGRKSVLVTGDGSFQMNLNELATAVTYKVPVVIIIINNGVLGLVRQWQRQFYGERFSSTTLCRKTDYVKLAEAFGAAGFYAENDEQLKLALDFAFAQTEIPTVIDCHIDPDAKVLPMIPPGGSIADLITH